jgi:hypothetical protein
MHTYIHAHAKQQSYTISCARIYWINILIFKCPEAVHYTTDVLKGEGVVSLFETLLPWSQTNTAAISRRLSVIKIEMIYTSVEAYSSSRHCTMSMRHAIVSILQDVNKCAGEMLAHCSLILFRLTEQRCCIQLSTFLLIWFEFQPHFSFSFLAACCNGRSDASIRFSTFIHFGYCSCIFTTPLKPKLV